MKQVQRIQFVWAWCLVIFFGGVLVLVAWSAFAQTDPRMPAIENQFLAQQLTEKAQQSARLGALLTIEQAKSANLQEWLNLAWPAYSKPAQ